MTDGAKKVPKVQLASPSEKAFGEAFRTLFRNALNQARDGEGQHAILSIALAEWACVARMVDGDEVSLEALRQVLAWLAVNACVECGIVHGVPDASGAPSPHPIDPERMVH